MWLASWKPLKTSPTQKEQGPGTMSLDSAGPLFWFHCCKISNLVTGLLFLCETPKFLARPSIGQVGNFNI